MPPAIDLTGQRFGRLTVRERTTHRGRTAWVCDCDCGTRTVVQTHALRDPDRPTQSCGCGWALKDDAQVRDKMLTVPVTVDERERINRYAREHGMSVSQMIREYLIADGIIPDPASAPNTVAYRLGVDRDRLRKLHSDGLSPRQIADQLGTSTGAVRIAAKLMGLTWPK